MEIKIGLQYVTRELSVETDETADQLKQKISEAIAAGTTLELVDVKGNQVLVSGSKIAYVELGQEHPRQVGFGSL